MNDRFKKIFLGVSIAIPFILYCVYYYTMMVRNAPFKFAEFNGIELKAGIGNQFEKNYSSKSGEYHYLNLRDSAIHTNVKLSKDDLLFLHHKAVELGLWNWPAKMLGKDSLTSPRYFLAFNYLRKKKMIEIDASYEANNKLKDAALQLIKIVDQTIADAEDKKRVK